MSEKIDADLEKIIGFVRKALPYEDGTFGWQNVVAALVLPLSVTDTVPEKKRGTKSNATEIELTEGSTVEKGKSKVEDFFPVLTYSVASPRRRLAFPVLLNAQNLRDLGEKRNFSTIWITDQLELNRRQNLNDAANPSLHIGFGKSIQPLRSLLNTRDYLVFTRDEQSPVYRAFGVKYSAEAEKTLGRRKKLFLSKAAEKEDVVWKLDEITSAVPAEASAADSRGLIQRVPQKTRPFMNAPLQWIVAGCPGSGKSQFLQQLQERLDPKAILIRTTLYADITYYQFVGAYKPVPLFGTDDKTYRSPDGIERRGSPFVTYRFVPGPLLRALADAMINPTYNVVLIIEEINRGNAAAVFGDYLQLLDRAESGESLYSIRPSDEICDFLAEVGVRNPGELQFPSNLYIWGTMNSADKGVFPLDSAFRRRWRYKYLGYKTPCAYPSGKAKIRYDGKDIGWEHFRSRLNEKLILLGAQEDKLIGPYFLSLDEMPDPEAVLNKLFYYLWDDVGRFKRAELTPAASFSHFGELWSDGSGAPLNINFD